MEKPMNETISQHIQIDNWIFEVKLVRALRVQSYGEPYSAIANIKFNGNNAYIDGMMQKNLQKFSDKDVQVIKKFCHQMSINDIHIDTNNRFLLSQPTIQPEANDDVLFKRA